MKDGEPIDASSISASLTVQVFFNDACICLAMKLVKSSRSRLMLARSRACRYAARSSTRTTVQGYPKLRPIGKLHAPHQILKARVLAQAVEPGVDFQ